MKTKRFLKHEEIHLDKHFKIWAVKYFSNPEHLNRKIDRKIMYDDLTLKDNKYITPLMFKEKVKMYCKSIGYIFNPLSYDPVSRLPIKYDKKTGDPIIDDKSGGIEYFTIGTPDYHFVNEIKTVVI